MKPAFVDETRALEFLQSPVVKERTPEYHTYFDSLRPTTPEDCFRRGLFAFASVHTTWTSNCRLYELLWPLDWLGDEKKLAARIVDSGAGLFRGRTKSIMQFADKYWQNPELYQKQPGETWFECRDRIAKNTLGLGAAKAAFFLEMTYFQDCESSCFDVHMVKLFGYDAQKYRVSGVTAKFIHYCERFWAEACKTYRVPPVTARWIYWDQKQQETNSRYWSKVLEGNPDGMFATKQLWLFDTMPFFEPKLKEPDETTQEANGLDGSAEG